MGGFFGGFAQGIGEQVDRKHEEEQANKRQLRDFYLQGVINAPNSQVAEHAAGEYGKLLHPEARKGWQKATDWLLGLHRMRDQANAAQPTAAPASAPVPAPAPAATVSSGEAAQAATAEPTGMTGQGPLKAGTPIISQTNTDKFNAGPTAAAPEAPPATGPQAKAAFNQGPKLTKAQQLAQSIQGIYPTGEERYRIKTAEEEQTDARYEKKGRALGLTGRDLAEFIGSRGQRLPSAGSRGTFKTVKYLLPGEKEPITLRQNSVTNALETLQGNPYSLPEGAKEVEQKTNMVKMPYRPKGADPDSDPRIALVDPRDPSRRFDLGTNEPLGTDIEPVDEQREIARIRANAYSEGEKLAVSYRREYAAQYPQLTTQQINELASRAGARDAIARYNKQTQYIGAGHEVLGEDALHNSIAIALQRLPVGNPPVAAPPGAPPPAAHEHESRTLPATGGAAPGAPPAAAPQGRTPAPAPPPATQSAPRSAAPASPPPAAGNRLLGGVTPAAARLAYTQSAPVTGLVLQTWGDPKDPSFKGMSSYADLSNNAQSKERIGQAIQQTLSGLGDGIGDAAIGGGAGPVHISSGGFGQWLQNALGMPGRIASQDAHKIRDLLEAMTPREREAYNATMAQLSMLAGARKMSNSGVAVAFLRLIENEFPKIGVNAVDSRTFNDQLSRTAKEIDNYVTNGPFPKVRDASGKQMPVGIDPDMLSYIHKIASEGPKPAPVSKGGQRKPLSAYEK